MEQTQKKTAKPYSPEFRERAVRLAMELGVARAAEMLASALPVGRKIVIDADGLTALAADAALFAQLHSGCVADAAWRRVRAPFP